MTKITVTEVSSAIVPGKLLAHMRHREILFLPDLGYVIAPAETIAALSDQVAVLEKMFPHRETVTVDIETPRQTPRAASPDVL